MPEIQVAVRDFSVSASAHGEGSTAVVLGPGAGGSRRTPLLLGLAEALAASGRRVVLFNFPYTEAGRRRPDETAVLEMTVSGVAEHVRDRWVPRKLVLGGKSMGGRIASQAVAKGTAADGLLFLGYPLHPPGKPEVLRDAHFPRIRIPMLFVQGTRDPFARADLLEALLARLGERARLHRVEGGDHSLVRPKSAGGTAAPVEAEIARAALQWLADHGL